MKQATAVLCALVLAAALAACGPGPEGQNSSRGNGQGGQASSGRTSSGETPGETPTPSTPETTTEAAPEPTAMETTVAAAGGEPGRIHEEAGGFSWVPPEGWEQTEVPGMKYRAAVGPAGGGFAPNLNVVDEPFPGPLDAYAEANVEALRSTLRDFRLISQQRFSADAGDEGIEIATESVRQNVRFRQTFYVFDGGDAKLVVTCSRLADESQREVDAACDDSMETFRVE